ncbi:malto-oligosyltrehalose trehalohydrolase [Streptomyces sp. O3]
MRFEVWAPQADRVALQLEGATHALERDPERTGWWAGEADAGDGARYGFVLDDGPVRPDPRSARQPDGPDGLSAVVDHDRHTWRAEWAGRGLRDAVLYELHIGTYTPAGTLDSATERLGHLAELGVTHVELMPLCPFPGRHGWGYEGGGSPWAVHEPYGGPEALKRLVDRAHELGLGVVLDVVHHHLGPSGGHLSAFGPYVTDAHRTPGDAAVNLDAPGSDEVRAYLVGSALSWLRDYRIDGLRLDAVHALRDTRARHYLEELSAAVDALADDVGRPLFLVGESDLGDPRVSTPRAAGGLGLHAQWNDDFHRALHTALTGESQGCYADFARAPLAALAKTLSRGFFHDGTYSAFRGRSHGRPVDRTTTPAHRFVGFAQAHGRIGDPALGDPALGDRLSATLSPGLLACAAALTLTAPFTPMLFMGEEWGARTPWRHFTDRTDPAGLDRSRLDWSEPEREPHARLLAWYRELIALRRAQPDLTDPDLAAVRSAYSESARWFAFRRGDLRIAVNLGAEPAEIPLRNGPERVLAAWGPVEAPGPDGRLHVPGESCVLLTPAKS